MSLTSRAFLISIVTAVWIVLHFLHIDFSSLTFEVLILVTTFWVGLALFGGMVGNFSRGPQQWRFWGKLFMLDIFTVGWLVIFSYGSYGVQVWDTFVFCFLAGSTVYLIVKQLVVFRLLKLPVRIKTPKSEEQVVREGEVIDSDAKRNAELYSWKKNPDWKVLVYHDKNTEEVYHRWTLPEVTTVREAFQLQWEGIEFEEEY